MKTSLRGRHGLLFHPIPGTRKMKMFADDLKHPSYGSLDNLLADIKHDIYQGYYPRIGQIGALNWFCEQVRRGDADGHQLQSMADLTHKPI